MTYYEAIEEVKNKWGDNVLIKACLAHKIPMTFDEFLTHCTCCGGNWGGMLLTGIHEFYPEVWDVIPEDMGWNPFHTICAMLVLLGVKFEKED